MTAKTRGAAIAEIERSRDALVVLDVDEVVLEFIGPFQDLLSEHGARLHFESYKLTGNARSRSTGAALSGGELDDIMRRLYAEQAVRQKPVPGVGPALKALSLQADIVFLTAMDPDFYDTRRACLNAADLPFPMIATERSKGGVVAELAERWDGPIIFVDDLPPNLESVKRSVPGVHLIHLMAHHGFRPHLPPLPQGAVSAEDWRHAATMIASLIAAAPADGVVQEG